MKDVQKIDYEEISNSSERSRSLLDLDDFCKIKESHKRTLKKLGEFEEKNGGQTAETNELRLKINRDIRKMELEIWRIPREINSNDDLSPREIKSFYFSK